SICEKKRSEHILCSDLAFLWDLPGSNRSPTRCNRLAPPAELKTHCVAQQDLIIAYCFSLCKTARWSSISRLPLVETKVVRTAPERSTRTLIRLGLPVSSSNTP